MNREQQSILSSSIMASIRSNTKYLYALKSSTGVRATKGKQTFQKMGHGDSY